MCALGSSVGSPAHAERQAYAMLDQMAVAMDRLDWGRVRACVRIFFFQRASLSLPRFAFILRTCPPDSIRKAIARFEEMQGGAFSRLLGGEAIPAEALEHAALVRGR